MPHRSLRRLARPSFSAIAGYPGAFIAWAWLVSCSASDPLAGGQGPGSDPGASEPPADAAGEASRPIDASVETSSTADSASPLLADSSGASSRPADASPEASRPGDASLEASRPVDASGEASRPVDASGEASRPVDASRVDSANLPAITVWIAGDSTVQNYAPGNAEGENGSDLEGWGQEIGQFFGANVTIQNQAIGGRSVADFIYNVVRDAAGDFECVDDAGDPDYQLDANGNRTDPTQWATIKAGIKPGDFLLIQFGTNDETHTCPRFVTLPDFEADLGIMAATVRAKGATPIFVTPMGHREFNANGTVDNTLLPYANAMKTEATAESIEVEDLNLASVAYYASVGDSFLAASIFDGGTTHFVKAGAVEMATLIAGEIRTNDGPLASYLK